MSEETLNNVPQSMVGTIIPANISNQSIEHATSIINRVEALENELFSLPLRIQNLNWKQFCDKEETFKLVGSNFEIALHEEQVLICENITYESNTRMIISNPNHLIPNIEGARNINIYTKSNKGINAKGFMTEQYKNNVGIISYISFLPGKKIFGLFFRTSGVGQFYYIGNCKTDTVIPNITINPNVVPRSLTSLLTETDKVIISNASSRFKNQLPSWYYLGDALRYFNSLIFETIDPAYIAKLMILNKSLSFTSEE